MLLMGTSDKPYLADLKTFCKTYERILMVPRPDYSSRYGETCQSQPMWWRQQAEQWGGAGEGGL